MMRMLVACPTCERKYDATGREVGSYFRCHCGEVVTVTKPKGHDASVIRCSGCGAPREKGRNRCGFCGADFSIHERDLHTVCPQCLTRVSDKARFCQHCGTRLSGESVAEIGSEFKCPVCGGEKKLVHRRLGREQVDVLECSFCAGLWLQMDNFVQLRSRIAKESTSGGQFFSRKPKPSALRKHVGPRYRQCIYCDKHMHRRQYARGSGVIIDVCRAHGVWFDAEELQQTLDWIARGGVPDKPLSRPQKKKITPQSRPEETEPRAARRRPRREGDFLDDVLETLFGGISSWLG